MVTLPCHPEFKVTKSVSKSGTKISREDVDRIFAEKFDIQALSLLLDQDIDEVTDYIRGYITSKSVTKLIELIDFLNEEKTRIEILNFLEIGNQTKNFTTNIKPLLINGLIELTIPDKPNSQFQKYRLTEKGKKLLK